MILRFLVWILILKVIYSEVVVYIVPHSHTDAGWLLTGDQYKFTTNRILRNTLDELKKDPKRRFIFQEMYFFEHFYQGLTEDERLEVKRLVKQKQLEFVGGGYVLNDEACPTFEMMHRNFQLGHGLLREIFGEIDIQSGWMIDPFGHSRTIPTLFDFMGLKYGVLNRIDERRKRAYGLDSELIKQKKMQFFWDTPHHSDGIFMHILHEHYSAPLRFDAEEYPYWNMEKAVPEFIEYINGVQQKYKVNDLLIPWGDDFRYQYAESQFNRIDKLIEAVNANQTNGITVRYSTLSEYFASVKKNDFPIKPSSEDFFPYTQCSHSDMKKDTCARYWTGYFTSHPNLKKLIRESNNDLRIGQMITFWLQHFGNSVSHNQLKLLHRAVSLTQHHDAITGTSKNYVQKDYQDQLTDARTKLRNFLANSTIQLIGGSLTIANEFTLDNDRLLITVSNPINQIRSTYIQFKVKTINIENVNIEFSIYGSKKILKSEIINLGEVSLVYIFVPQIPAYGYITILAATGNKKVTKPNSKTTAFQGTLQNDQLRVTFEKEAGNCWKMKKVHMKEKSYLLEQNYLLYESRDGDGAYVFRPKDEAQELPSSCKILHYHKGELIERLTQEISPKVSETIILMRSFDQTELQNLIQYEIHNPTLGDTDELITRFTTEIHSESKLYTDTNSYEIMERKSMEIRFSDNTTASRIAGNYYPVTSSASIHGKISDETMSFSITTRNSNGVASLRNGEIEMMLNRQSLTDDGKGLNEKITMQAPAEISFQIRLEKQPESFEEVFQNRAQLFDHQLFIQYFRENDLKGISRPLLSEWKSHSKLLMRVDKDYVTNKFFLHIQNPTKSNQAIDFTNIIKGKKLFMIPISLTGLTEFNRTISAVASKGVQSFLISHTESLPNPIRYDMNDQSPPSEIFSTIFYGFLIGIASALFFAQLGLLVSVLGLLRGARRHYRHILNLN